MTRRLCSPFTMWSGNVASNYRNSLEMLDFTEAPECLPAEIRFAQEKEFAHRLIAEQAEWLTLPKAIKQTEDLLKAANEQSKPFLLEYRAYLGRRLKQAIAKAA